MKRITIRLDEETQTILDKVMEEDNKSSVSQYVRNAVKFYYQQQTKFHKGDFIEEISNLREELQGIVGKVNSVNISKEQLVEQPENRNKENAEDLELLEFVLRTGTQFMNLGRKNKQSIDNMQVEENKEIAVALEDDFDF